MNKKRFYKKGFFGGRAFYLILIVSLIIIAGLYLGLRKMDRYGYLKPYIFLALGVIIVGTAGFIIYWSLMGRATY